MGNHQFNRQCAVSVTKGRSWCCFDLDQYQAILDIVDDTSAYQLPLGSAGEAAIYTDHFRELSLLRKILLRMRSWQNYIFLEGI